MKLVIGLQHCTPDMAVHGVYVWRTWMPLILSDAFRAADLKPFLCDVYCMGCRNILMKEETATNILKAVLILVLAN